eukprot:2516991-Pleurochrysis_carterae.AAC.2
MQPYMHAHAYFILVAPGSPRTRLSLTALWGGGLPLSLASIQTTRVPLVALAHIFRVYMYTQAIPRTPSFGVYLVIVYYSGSA